MSSSAEPLFSAPFRVSMADVDAARIIYFVTPMRWKEWLFTGWLQEVGHPLAGLIDGGFAMPTVATHSEYATALRLDDHVRGDLYAAHVGRSSFGIVARFYRGDDQAPAVEVSSWHVWSRMGEGHHDPVRGQPLPSWLRDALSSSLIETAPEA